MQQGESVDVQLSLKSAANGHHSRVSCAVLSMNRRAVMCMLEHPQSGISVLCILSRLDVGFFYLS